MRNRTDALAGFKQALTATPDAIAVAGDHCAHTYTELAAESGGYAAELAGHGVGPGDLVAVVAERSPQFVAMVLGVLWTGAAYLPVEPSTPPDRARRMCATAAVPVLLVQPGHEEYAKQLGVSTVVTADPAAATSFDPAPREPDGLAYVIFTSGSTGVPKGAMVTDGGMDNHLEAKRLDLALTPSDVVALTAPLSFDISVWQAIAPLTAGGRVAVGSAANLSEPAELAAWVARHGVTVLEVVPSYLTVILDALDGSPRLRSALDPLRLLVATGEALPSVLARRWHKLRPEVPIMNAYGPTECSDDVTHHFVTPADCAAGDWAPIGQKIINTDLYVVDPAGAVVPDGAEGELLVGGAGVGRGYLGDPAGTGLAFLPDYLSGRPGRRLYRTGDRVRREADGTLHYLGRRDRQVKVRGHRIELGEVEAQLLRIDGVAAAACVVVTGQLRAFITLRGGMASTSDSILGELRELVPAHLVPQRLTVLDRIPTTTAGKADLRALAACSDEPALAEPAVPTEAPRDESSRIAALMADALRVNRIGPEDNFFAAGGDSLQAMRLVASVRSAFGVEGVALRDFIADPTLRGLVAALRAGEVRALTAGPEPATGKLSSGQERLWFVENLNRGKDPLLIHLELTLRGALDQTALQYALDAVVARHEPLRTVFGQSRGVPVATVWPHAPIPIQPLATDGPPPAPALSVGSKEPPLMAAYLACIGPDEHVLTLVLHHLVADGWSLMVLSQDIAEYYQRFRAGDTAVPVPLVSFGQYVAAERQWLASPEAAQSENYWREQLAGAPPAIELPLRPRPAKPDFRTAAEIRELTNEETAALRALAREAHATPFMVVLSAFAIVLADITGIDDLVIGIDSVNRSWPGSEELVGTFVNQLPVRLTGAGSGFSNLLALTRQRCLAAYQHDRLPFHKIVAAVNPPRLSGRFPLYQVKATHQSAWRTGVTLPGLEVTPREIPDKVMDSDLMLDMSGESSRLRLELVYLPERLAAETAADWADAVTAVLRHGLTTERR